MTKKELWSRLGVYITFALLLPVAFLIWRFNLFTKTDSIAIGGWGIVAICFVAGFFIKLLKTVRKGLNPSLATQVLDGITSVILPLFIFAFATYYLQDVMHQMFQFLCVLIVCESVAIVANPLPQWYREHPSSSSSDGLLKYIIDTLKKISEDKKE